MTTTMTNFSKGSPLANYLNREYGDMLPKTNLTNLPDFKVTEFIRVLGEYHKKCESQQKYLSAKKARGKLREIA